MKEWITKKLAAFRFWRQRRFHYRTRRLDSESNQEYDFPRRGNGATKREHTYPGSNETVCITEY